MNKMNAENVMTDAKEITGANVMTDVSGTRDVNAADALSQEDKL